MCLSHKLCYGLFVIHIQGCDRNNLIILVTLIVDNEKIQIKLQKNTKNTTKIQDTKTKK